MNRRIGLTRRIGTGVLAAALALAIAPTLTGCFGIDKRLRVGYAYGTEVLRRGLASLSEWLESRFPN